MEKNKEIRILLQPHNNVFIMSKQYRYQQNYLLDLVFYYLFI